LFLSPAEAQLTTGGHSSSAVAVDNSVLEQLGPAPTAKAQPSRVTKAPAKSASPRNQIVHLIPPKSRLAGAAPASTSQTAHQAVSHPETATSAPTEPSVAALAAPAQTQAPKQSPSDDAPTAPPVSPQPMSAPVAAPSEPVATATPRTPPATVATTVTAAPPSNTAITPAAPAASAPPVQVATAATVGSAEMAVKFKPGVTELGSGAQPVLDALANRLLANQELRVALISHATGAADNAMEARRISLARAVAVRAYLVDKGVKSLRIDVRALGNRADQGPIADQVDFQVVSQ